MSATKPSASLTASSGTTTTACAAHAANTARRRGRPATSSGRVRPSASLEAKRRAAVILDVLNNHFHLLIRPVGGSISRIMQSLLVSHTQRYHLNHRSGGHVWQGRFKSPVIQNDEHLLTVLRYIEANPLRAGIADRAEDYPWSSYRAHALDEADDLVDPLINFEELSPYPAIRRRKWSEIVHRPLEEPTLASIRRSNSTGMPYGERQKGSGKAPGKTA